MTEAKCTRRRFIKESGKVLLGFLGIEVLAACEGLVGTPPKWMPPVVNRYWDTIVSEANSLGLDPVLIASVMAVESGFFSKSESKLEAKGLMQIMPKTAEEIATKLGLSNYDLFDPQTSIRMGASYLKWQIQAEDGDVQRGLCRYYGKCLKIYDGRIMRLVADANKEKSDGFNAWLRSVNSTPSNCGGTGADLRCAFEEQGLDYDQWYRSVSLKCASVAAPNDLPSLIHPGDTVGGKVVEPGNSASGIWIEKGKPEVIQVCTQ